MSSEPSSATGITNNEWYYEATQIVAHVPSFSELEIVSGTGEAQPWTGNAPVAAFDLFSLVIPSPCNYHPKMWNWKPYALGVLKTLTKKGYIVVILSNKWRSYSPEDIKFPRFNSLYEFMVRLNCSYLDFVCDKGDFIFAKPKQKFAAVENVSQKNTNDGIRKHDIRMWNALKTTLQGRLPEDVQINYARSFFVGNSTEHRQFADEAGLKYADNLPHFEEGGEPIFSDLPFESNISRSREKKKVREQHFEYVYC